MLLSACLSVLLVLGSSQGGALAPAEVEAWRGDLRFLAREMEARHKDLYHSVSREAFAARVAALDERLPTLARHEVIVELTKLVAAVGDGHTNLYPTRDPKVGFHSLPVAFAFFEDGLYVRAAHESQRALVGAKVVGLGARDTPSAYAEVKALIGRDNEQGARYWAPYLLAMPEVLHALRLTQTLEDVPLRLATEQGERTVVLHPFEPVPMMSGERATMFDRRDGWCDARDGAARPEPAWLRSGGAGFRLEHIGETLYVQLTAILDEPGETLAAFAQRMKDEIERTRPDKVALDLRLNRGGNGTLLPPLIRALVQSESVDRPGHLFALVGPATFSAAQFLVDALERYTQVTFVGEPTGSKGNAYGDSRKIVLPQSGLTVRVSIYYWQDWHPEDTRDATTPQIAAPLTFAAYRANVDPALEAALQAPAPGR